MDKYPSRQEAVIVRLYGRGITLYVDGEKIRAKVPRGLKIYDSDRKDIDICYKQIRNMLTESEASRISNVIHAIEMLAGEYPACQGCELDALDGYSIYAFGGGLVNDEGAAFVANLRNTLNAVREEMKTHDHTYVQTELA